MGISESTDQQTLTPPIKVYSTRYCPYCQRARALLKAKGVSYTEIDIGSNPALWQEMQAISGRDTVPQIFIGETHVGGCDDLIALDQAGKLAPLLAGESI